MASNAKKTVESTQAAAAAADPGSWLSARVAGAIYAVLSLVYFLPAFLPRRQVFGTDYLAGGYMFYNFIGERLASGALPKWVPFVYGGMPLAANPGSTYHPVHLIADLLLPTSKVLAVVFVAHFWLAGIGMNLLVRELGCRRWIAFLAGLSFQFTGIVASWVYAGHDGRIIVAASAPLFYYCLRRGIATNTLRPFIGAALTLGGALLSFQIQLSYYLLVGGLIWAIFSLWDLGVFRTAPRLIRTLSLGVLSVAFGFALAAVNLLPFVDYVPESPRAEGGRGYEFSTSFSMPPGELLSLAVPEHHGASISNPETGQPLFPQYQGANGFKLHTEYVGGLVLVLLAVGAFYCRRNRVWWFFAGLSLFAATIAFGGNTPLYRLYYAALPGTKQFRAPSLIFFVIALSLVVMAALALERLAQLRREAPATAKSPDAQGKDAKPLMWIAGAWALVGLLGAAASQGDAEVARGWMRMGLFTGACGAILVIWMKGRMGPLATCVLLAAVTLVDLWSIDRRFFHTVAGPEYVFAADDITTFLDTQPGSFRVWTFPFPETWRAGGPNGGNFPMLFELEQAGGEHPNPLRRWVEYIGAGTTTFTDWHNFVDVDNAQIVETPGGQAVRFQSRPGFLEAANIRYIISMIPLEHPSLREVHRGSALVYENTAALERAYLVPTVRSVPSDSTLHAISDGRWNPAAEAVVPVDADINLPASPLEGTATVSSYLPDQLIVQSSASREALLVVADNFYDGWVATVDGEETPIVRANHSFRGVVVPAGSHQVQFDYRPADLYLGLGISIGTFLLLAILFTAAGYNRGRDAVGVA